MSLEARSTLLDRELQRMASRGWRPDVRYATQATVSRTRIWLPWWIHIVLVLVTCLAWLIVVALLMRPRFPRTYRLVTVDPGGFVTTTKVAGVLR